MQFYTVMDLIRWIIPDKKKEELIVFAKYYHFSPEDASMRYAKKVFAPLTWKALT